MLNIRNIRFVALFATLALFAAACGDQYTGGAGGGNPDDTTTVTEAPGNGDNGDDTTDEEVALRWPLVDDQLLPTGVEEGAYGSQLRNLGYDQKDLGLQSVYDRTQVEPLFAAELAQANGGEAGRLVGFYGLSGLWDADIGWWNEAGFNFLEQLFEEVENQYYGIGTLPEGKVWVVLANHEEDAVRLLFDGSELPLAGELVLFSVDGCGSFGVDVRGNLYIPCDCVKIPPKRVPPPPPPPVVTTVPPGTTVPPPPPVTTTTLKPPVNTVAPPPTTGAPTGSTTPSPTSPSTIADPPEVTNPQPATDTSAPLPPASPGSAPCDPRAPRGSPGSCDG